MGFFDSYINHLKANIPRTEEEWATVFGGDSYDKPSQALSQTGMPISREGAINVERATTNERLRRDQEAFDNLSQQFAPPQSQPIDQDLIPLSEIDQIVNRQTNQTRNESDRIVNELQKYNSPDYLRERLDVGFDDAQRRAAETWKYKDKELQYQSIGRDKQIASNDLAQKLAAYSSSMNSSNGVIQQLLSRKIGE